jgi:hypothetical protein
MLAHDELRIEPLSSWLLDEVGRTSRAGDIGQISHEPHSLSSREGKGSGGLRAAEMPYAALLRRTPPPSVSITLFSSLTQA